MITAREDCRQIRERLLDHLVEAGGAAWPAETIPHLDACVECRRYAGALQTTRHRGEGATGRTTLYGPDLRRRTLAAVRAAQVVGTPDPARAGAAPSPAWLRAVAARTAMVSILVVASAAGVFAMYVLPVWLTTRLLDPLFAPGWMAIATAVAACSSLGLCAVGPGVIALLRARHSTTSFAGERLNGWR